MFRVSELKSHMSKIIALNKNELFATKLALEGAADGILVAPAALIRAKATELLASVGVKVAPKAKWSKLSQTFNTTFERVLN